jgi:NADH-ubiquinone oxidoreductase chain 5
VGKVLGTSFEFPILLDIYSILFLFTIRAIAGSIFIFSINYIAQEKFFIRFHILVLIFVVSMLLLIISPNLITILLGWDGLGVTSYLLVIYFQRTKSANAGIITALTNRIGDVLILLAIGRLASRGA